MSQQGQWCGYRRGGTVEGVTYVHEAFARSLVSAERINEILRIHRSGEMSVTTVLEYSARRGRARVTQALVAEGVTVTREAINAAAKKRGPGLALLLAGLRGEALEMARQDALQAWLTYGEFERALELLQGGVCPNAACYGALERGAKGRFNEGWVLPCQRVLEALIAATPHAEFTDEALGLILRAGRPLHVERVLERLKRRPLDLLRLALCERAPSALARLRQAGLRMGDDAFSEVTADLIRRHLLCRADLAPLLTMYVEDCGQVMSAGVAEPLVLALLHDREYALRGIRGPSDAAYQRAREVLLPIMSCMDVSEHLKLDEVIDRWAAAASAPMVPVTVTAVLKHTIHATHRAALAGLAGERPSL